VFCSDCVDVFGVGPLGVDLLLKDEGSKLGFVRCVPLNSTLFCFHVGWIVAQLWSRFGFGDVVVSCQTRLKTSNNQIRYLRNTSYFVTFNIAYFAQIDYLAQIAYFAQTAYF
jgi:hypothetical protein